MKYGKKRGLTVSVKDEHIIRVHNDLKDVLDDINRQLQKKGLIKEFNNPLATKILGDHIKRNGGIKLDIDVNMRKIKRKVRMRL